MTTVWAVEEPHECVLEIFTTEEEAKKCALHAGYSVIVTPWEVKERFLTFEEREAENLREILTLLYDGEITVEEALERLEAV
jgi:hypothetical protein